MFSPGGGPAHDVEHQLLLSRLAALESGTSTGNSGSWANRPTAPTTGQMYFATDSTRRMWFVWNGTLWLSETLFHSDFTLDQGARPITTGAVAGTTYATVRASVGELQYITANGGLYVEAVIYHHFVSVAGVAANYFDWRWIYTNNVGGVSGALTISGAANTQGSPTGWHTYNLLTPGSGVTIADGTLAHFQLDITLRGGTPTAHSIYPQGSVHYRVIGG